MNFDRIYLQIKHCDDGVCSAYLPSYAQDLTRSDIEVLLSKPIQYQLTRCNLPLWSAVGNSLTDNGYFLPANEPLLVETLAFLISVDRFFQGPILDQRVLMPGFLRFDDFELSAGEYVCGPLTSYRSAEGMQFAQSKYRQFRTANYDNDRELAVSLLEGESGGLRIRALNKRYAIVVEPPVGKSRSDGSAHCGGEPSIGMRAWLLDRATKLGNSARFTKLLEWRAGSHDCWGDSQLFEVSPDLLRVTRIEGDYYDEGAAEKIFTAFCFDKEQLKYLL